jgi:hypothetical protein
MRFQQVQMMCSCVSRYQFKTIATRELLTFGVGSGIGCAANVLREDSNNVSRVSSGLVEELGGNSLDAVSQRRKQFGPGLAFGASRSRKIVQGSIANLALHDVIVIQHGEPECHPLLVVPDDLVTRKRHESRLD